MPLTGAECRPDVSHIKREVEESWADLGINANLSGAGRPLPKIPIPISQETIEVIRAAAAVTAAAAPENSNEKEVSTRARAAQTINVATKSQATLAKETPKKMRSAFCQTATPKTHRESSIAIQTDAAAADDDDREPEEGEQPPKLNECSCQKKKGGVEVLANRGNEYYVVYKDRAEPVWENESAIDEALIQTFKERTNPHLAKGGAEFSASAIDNHEGPPPPEGSAAVERDGGDLPKSSLSAASEVPASNKSQSRRKSGAPTKVTKEETLPEKRTRRRKPEKPLKVTDEERTTVIAPKKIVNEGDLSDHEKDEKGEETPNNGRDEVPEENALVPESNLVEELQNEVDKNTVTRKRSKRSRANSSMDAAVSPRSRRKSSAHALTKFRKWGAAEEEEDDDERVRKTGRQATAPTTDVDKVVSEFQAELDLDMSQVDDSGMLASHRGHCDPEYLAREQTKREREEERKSRLINKKLKLTEE